MADADAAEPPAEERLVGWEAVNKTYDLGLTPAEIANLDTNEPPKNLLEYTDGDVRELASEYIGEDDARFDRFLSAVSEMRAKGNVPDEVETTRELKIVLIGRMAVGKTTLFNTLTGSSHETSAQGRCTTQIQKANGVVPSEDGRWKWPVHVVDTPGIDDDKLRDERTFKEVDALLNKELVDIDAVLLVHNSEAPVLDRSLIEAVFKYRDLFGDAFVSNWGIVYTRWKSDARSIAQRDEDASDMIREEAEKVLKDSGLDRLPSQFFFLDNVPGNTPGELKARKNEVDRLLNWVHSLKPIQTKEFNGLASCVQEHRRHKAKLSSFWDVEYKAVVQLETKPDGGGDDHVLVLTRTKLNLLKTVPSYAFALGFPGKFYDVTVITLHGIQQRTCEGLSGQSNTLNGFLTRLEDFGNIYIVNVVEGDKGKDSVVDPESGTKMSKNIQPFHLYLKSFQHIKT
eukprot:m.59695 g.59695  ORF g.59695 m.59695 type:complete len:456 (+) comp9474_c0_seq1:117-1484(+)